MTAAADVTRRSPRRVFRDRREAGRVLAELLAAYRDQPDVIVLGLARGGLPVAWEVAAALHAPLDAFVVRKLGAPGHDEFAVGALASGGRVVVNDDVVRGSGSHRSNCATSPNVRVGNCFGASPPTAASARPPISPARRSLSSMTVWPPAQACSRRYRHCAMRNQRRS